MSCVSTEMNFLILLSLIKVNNELDSFHTTIKVRTHAKNGISFTYEILIDTAMGNVKKRQMNHPRLGDGELIK